MQHSLSENEFHQKDGNTDLNLYLKIILKKYITVNNDFSKLITKFIFMYKGVNVNILPNYKSQFDK